MAESDTPTVSVDLENEDSQPSEQSQPPPASPSRTSGLVGKDFKAQTSEDPQTLNEVAPSSEDEKTTGQKLASWWENKAKPGIQAFSSTSKRQFAVMSQQLNERMGKATKTVDLDLQPRIDRLREMHKQYKALNEMTKSMLKHYELVAKTQEAIGGQMEKISKLEEQPVSNMFQSQANFMTVNGRNMMGLTEEVKFFQGQVEKIILRIDETLKTVRQFESMRLEYDSYRVSYEKQKAANKSVEVAEGKFLDAYNRYQTQRGITVKALEEMEGAKMESLKQQFSGLVNAYSIFQSGNQSALAECKDSMKQKE